ncbi:hypothetical protein Tsubulata_048543, partial [Turnera subulata]
VKLLGHLPSLPSPFVYRVIWALKIKGIHYEFVEEDIANKSPSLLKCNPVQKRIPVLVHAGKPTCESMIIVQYIDEVWPQNPLLPSDPHERAVARFWVKFAEDKSPSVFKIYRSAGEEMEQAVMETKEMLQAIEDHGLGNKKFFVIKENLPDWDETVAFFRARRQPKFRSLSTHNYISVLIMAEVKLLGKLPSPFTFRVTWALKIKGIPYEFVEEDITNKSPLLLKYNPVHKKIPVLVHGEKPICESMIIVEYLDEVWPQNPLLPIDPHEKAVARFWVKFADDKGPSVYKMLCNTGEALEQAIKETLEMLQAIEDHGLGDTKFFGGDQIGIADIAFGSVIYGLAFVQEAVEVKLLEAQKFPRLHGWLKNFMQVPVIEETLPDWDETVASFRASREAILKAAAS